MQVQGAQPPPIKGLKDREYKAIELANQGQWEAAVEVNLEVLSVAPQDVEALNRLGRAYSELGHFGEARQTFQKVLKVSLGNPIAKRNLQRLEGLKEVGAPKAAGLAPGLFLQESGKTCVTSLVDLGSPRVLAKMAVGEALVLEPTDGRVEVRVPRGVLVGRIPPRLAARLQRLTKGGNRYVAAVASVESDRLRVLIREEYQHPSLVGVVSFPSSSRPSQTELDLERGERELQQRESEQDWGTPDVEEGERPPRRSDDDVEPSARADEDEDEKEE